MKPFDSPTECEILALSIFLEEDKQLYPTSLRAVFAAMRAH